MFIACQNSGLKEKHHPQNFALSASNENVTFFYHLSFFILTVIPPDIQYFFVVAVFLGQCVVATEAMGCHIWGHVSDLPRGRERIRENDIVCLSFSVLQLHCCDFLGRPGYSHISQLQRDCCNETRHCNVCAKSSHNHSLPLNEEHLQPGCRLQNGSGHPPEYVITEDIRLHSP